MSERAEAHAFEARPHRTLLALTGPVFVSLVAEPVTGLVDTAFVARLGTASLAALGIATTLLSSVYWVTNFLGIGTQTEIAGADGAGKRTRVREVAAVALALSAGIGALLGLAAWGALAPAARFMGAEGDVLADVQRYGAIRLIASPAVLITIAGMGVMRGLQDMRTPLAIALGINAVNLLLDPLLIFGLGPVPALGIAGAAWASLVAQVGGAAWTVALLARRVGLSWPADFREARVLLRAGRDLTARTALLLAFMLLATREANRIGELAGAAHQVVRQVWVLLALSLDAFATAAQSLAGYTLGAGRRAAARRVARVSVGWSLATGAALALGMLAAESLALRALVPEPAHAAFVPAWRVCAAFQPLCAVAFATDGLHWGSGDYAYLRNGMIATTLPATAALLAFGPRGLAAVWGITGLWIALRALWGTVRIWPGTPASPYAPTAPSSKKGPPA